MYIYIIYGKPLRMFILMKDLGYKRFDCLYAHIRCINVKHE